MLTMLDSSTEKATPTQAWEYHTAWVPGHEFDDRAREMAEDGWRLHTASRESQPAVGPGGRAHYPGWACIWERLRDRSRELSRKLDQAAGG